MYPHSGLSNVSPKSASSKRTFLGGASCAMLSHWLRRVGPCDLAIRCFYVICLVIFVVETSIVIVEYFKQPVGTTIAFIRDQNQEPLPYIQVCSQFWVDKRRLAKANVSEELFEYMKAGFLGFTNYKGKRNASKLAQLEEEFESLPSPFDYRRFFNSVALPRKRVIPYCKWQEGAHHCDLLFEPIFTPSGFCYLLRSENAPKQRVAGPGGGLRFLIRKRVELEPRIIYNTAFDDGIHLSISGQWQPQMTNPLFIAMGKRAFLQVTRTRFERVSRCTSTGRLWLFNETYSQSACLYECQVNATMRHCNCTTFTYNVRLSPNRFCTPGVYRKCMRPLLKRHTHSCLRDCPRACSNEETGTSTSYATNDPWRIRLYNKRRNRVRDWIYNDTIMVHVYYSQIGHTLVKEHWTVTWSTALSNVGGQLGLWMGVSALSITSILKRHVLRRLRPKNGENTV